MRFKDDAAMAVWGYKHEVEHEHWRVVESRHDPLKGKKNLAASTGRCKFALIRKLQIRLKK